MAIAKSVLFGLALKEVPGESLLKALNMPLVTDGGLSLTMMIQQHTAIKGIQSVEQVLKRDLHLVPTQQSKQDEKEFALLQRYIPPFRQITCARGQSSQRFRSVIGFGLTALMSETNSEGAGIVVCFTWSQFVNKVPEEERQKTLHTILDSYLPNAIQMLRSKNIEIQACPLVVNHATILQEEGELVFYGIMTVGSLTCFELPLRLHPDSLKRYEVFLNIRSIMLFTQVYKAVSCLVLPSDRTKSLKFWTRACCINHRVCHTNSCIHFTKQSGY
jgi:hypothetical protein